MEPSLWGLGGERRMVGYESLVSEGVWPTNEAVQVDVQAEPGAMALIARGMGSW